MRSMAAITISCRADQEAITDLIDDNGEDQQHPKQHHLHIGANLHEVHAVLLTAPLEQWICRSFEFLAQ